MGVVGVNAHRDYYSPLLILVKIDGFNPPDGESVDVDRLRTNKAVNTLVDGVDRYAFVEQRTVFEVGNPNVEYESCQKHDQTSF